MLKIVHVWDLAPENYQDRNLHWSEAIILTVPTWEKQIFPTQSTLDGVLFFFTSAVITGVQMGEMSKLGWMVGWSSRDMWADSLYFLYVVLGSICKTFASFQHISWPSSYACWANFDFSNKHCVRLYLCSLMRTSKVCLFHWCNICTFSTGRIYNSHL
jgi:hypothetical protein